MEHKSEWRCATCGAQLSSAHTLAAHNKRVHAAPEQSAACVECGRTFANKHYLYAHTLNKHRAESSRTRCHVCVRDFRTHRALTMHNNREHSGLSEWDCGTCGARLPSEEELRAHASAAHPPPPERTYPCAQCHKVFSSLVNMSCHERAAHGARRHECARCSLAFRSAQHLRRHVNNKHAHAESHACDVCARVFTNILYLKEHSVLHAEGGRVECERCHKKFAGRARLNKHIKTVHGAAELGTEYACGECSMRFSCAGYLARHQDTVHAPPGPTLPCPRQHCTKAFKNKRYLHYHTLRHEERDRKQKEKEALPASGARRSRRRRASGAERDACEGDGTTREQEEEIARLRELNFIKCEPAPYSPSTSPCPSPTYPPSVLT